MDCCNYMQYRQQYYGSQYYEPPAYHDFYGHQMYQEYYGSPYYHQQWPCAAFPDYVYNPKEARIRKAMRDASRERSSIAGTSPMLARPNARRVSSQQQQQQQQQQHSWVQPPPPPPHDELMMPPLASIQASPVCGFPLPSSAGNDQYMGGITAYGKMEPGAPPPPMLPPSPPSSSDYMQTNPLAQLQQQTEMWPEYQPMRSRSSGNPYMMGEVASYPGQSPDLATPLILDKEPPPAATSSSANEADKEQEQEQQFMPVFEQTDDSKMKKISKKATNKALPDFNEAFGSTERGRFQSPPDPRLGPSKSYLDYFFDSSPIKFDDYQI